MLSSDATNSGRVANVQRSRSITLPISGQTSALPDILELRQQGAGLSPAGGHAVREFRFNS